LDFAMVLAELVGFLSQRAIRHGVAGAMALHAHGLTRATTDLDLVVEESGRDALLAHMAALGYEQLHASAGFSNHLHPDRRWGRLDFIYVDAHTADLLFAGARRLEIYPGRSLLVPRPEHLAAMKVQAMKNDPSRSFQDLADIQALLSLPGVDEEEVRRYFEQHGLAARFEELQRARGRT
jgi:hypothetical protein